MDDRLAGIGGEKINDLLVNRNVHKSELIPRLDTFWSELDFNDAAVSAADTFPHNLLSDKSFDNSCKSTTRKAETPGKFSRSDLFGCAKRSKELELRSGQVEFARRPLNLDLAVLEQLICQISHLFCKLVFAGHWLLHGCSLR